MPSPPYDATSYQGLHMSLLQDARLKWVKVTKAKQLIFQINSICSSGVKEGLNRKDELFNDLLEMFRKRQLNFPKAMMVEATYFLQVGHIFKTNPYTTTSS